MDIDLEKFKTEKIAYHCRTEKEANSFLEIMNKNNINWAEKSKSNRWDYYMEETCYVYNCGRLMYSPLEFYHAKGYTIIEYKMGEDKMDNLSVREVMQALLDGKILVNEFGNEYKLGEKDIIFTNVTSKASRNFDIVTFDFHTYKPFFGIKPRFKKNDIVVHTTTGSLYVVESISGRFVVMQNKVRVLEENLELWGTATKIVG